MALTTKEKFNLHNNIVRPESMYIQDMIQLVAFSHAQWFLANAKTTTTGTPEDSYKTKMKNLAQRVKSKDTSVINLLKDDIINTRWGNIKNYNDIRVYSDDDYSTNIENVINESFESVADVSAEEKTAYNAL
ncbi:MAG: hypothetical protein QM564_11765 [Bergeyella sp.]